MKQPGAILLISCYELGHQPLGIASPLGFLERSGYSPDGLDIGLDPVDPTRIVRARLVGISVPMHTALRLGVRVARQVRALNPGCHICFYGLYAFLNGDYLLEHLADSVIGGEYEETLVDLAQALGSGTVGPLPGLRLRGGAASPVLARLPFALPSRHLLSPLHRYAALEVDGERRTAGYVEASRGCLHLCRHCPIPPVYDGRFFVVPREVVLEDIRLQVEAGARHITFGDPDFLNGPGHSMAILREMHRRFPSLNFDFTAKIEHLLRHRDFLPEMSALGCLFIVSAVESLSDRVLAILEKGHTRDDVGQALELVRGAGITLRPSLIPFTPWTTLEDYRDLLDFVEAHDLIDAVDPVQYAVRLLVPPGSRLLGHPLVRPRLGGLIGESFSYAWEHSDCLMESLNREVTVLVERAAHEKEDSFLTFQRIRDRFRALTGEESPGPILLSPASDRRRPPRLTESWFC